MSRQVHNSLLSVQTSDDSMLIHEDLAIKSLLEDSGEVWNINVKNVFLRFLTFFYFAQRFLFKKNMHWKSHQKLSSWSTFETAETN